MDLDTLTKRPYLILTVIFFALLGAYLLLRGYVSSDVRGITDGVMWVVLLLGLLSLILMRKKYTRASGPATKEELQRLGDIFVDRLSQTGKDVKELKSREVSEALKYADQEVAKQREAEKKKEE